MARVFLGSAGHWMNVVLTLVPIISSTDDWISGSVNRLMCPFRTVESRDNMRSEYNIVEEWTVILRTFLVPNLKWLTPIWETRKKIISTSISKALEADLVIDTNWHTQLSRGSTKIQTGKCYETWWDVRQRLLPGICCRVQLFLQPDIIAAFKWQSFNPLIYLWLRWQMNPFNLETVSCFVCLRV